MIPIEEIRLVPSEGNPDSKITIIGEAPGKEELKRNRPFCGPAGGVLEECMHAAGIIRQEVYLTNVFKFQIKKKYRGTGKSDIYHPKTDQLLWHFDKGYTDDALPYLADLEEELNGVKSNVLVPMGNVALDALRGHRAITKYRGSILQSEMGPVKCVPSIHPSSVLQSGDYLSRYYIVGDLRRALEESKYPMSGVPKQKFHICETYMDARLALLEVYSKGKQGLRINFDVEIIHEEISCLSFSWSHFDGYCIVIHGSFTEGEEIGIWQLIAKIIEDPDIWLCNQNILFDHITLLVQNRIIPRGRSDDPMVANHIIYPDFPKSLEFLTSIHTKVPYYKDDGKVWLKGIGGDPEGFYRYNIQDSMCAIECMNKLDIELDRSGHRDTYEWTVRCYNPLLAMMIRGMKVNFEELAVVKETMELLEKEKQAELDEMAGFHLNVKSPTQCVKYFYTDRNIPPYKHRKTGRPTTDDKAMARLAKGTSTRPGIPEAKLLQEIRSTRTMLSNYMGIVFDADKRMRCSYNPRGTTTGRLSSSKTLFQRGFNMQNLPEEFRQFLVADDGHLLVEIDKRQAEWVVVAYAANDPQMIEVVEHGLDPHSWTGALITGLDDLDLIKKESKIIGHETNPEKIKKLREDHLPKLVYYQESGGYLPRTMSVRQCGKKSNHGSNYGIKYKRFAVENEILEGEANFILKAYHKAYPGIQGRFHRSVREQLKKDRTVVNCFGRQRRFLGRWGPDLFNQAYDFVAQSTVADLINRGMCYMYEDVEEYMALMELLAQIHDSILFQYPFSSTNLKGNRELAFAIHKSFEYLNPTMEYNGREFQIASDVKAGHNWRDMTEIDNAQNLDGLAHSLLEIYRGQ